MTFAQSPYPDVVNIGLRIQEIRSVLVAVGWDTSSLDTKLKALRDDNGGVPLPNGVTETAADMRETFEALPQIMQQASSLYEVEYLKAAPVNPAAPPQTAEVEFDVASTTLSGDTPGASFIAVRLDTSDAQPLEVEVQVDVRDLLTGTALTPAHYTFPTPTTITFPVGHVSGNTVGAGFTNAGANPSPDRTINLDLDPASIVGPAVLGPQTTHLVTLLNIGA